MLNTKLRRLKTKSFSVTYLRYSHTVTLHGTAKPKQVVSKIIVLLAEESFYNWNMYDGYLPHYKYFVKLLPTYVSI